MANTPTLAEELFERIKSSPDPAAFLKAMADPSLPTFESDYLDFKAQPDKDPKDTQLRQIWYEALSGFANSGGGVLIWGIDARLDPATGMYAACDVKPIRNPNAFKSRLIELQRGATDPPLGNVMIETWESNPGEGFVVCLIPSGPFKPYRAEVSGKKQFHMRSGDKFCVPSVAVLRALFYPQSRAVFQVHARLVCRPNPVVVNLDEGVLTEGTLQVENIGTGTADSPYIDIDMEPSARRNEVVQMPGWQVINWDGTNWSCERERPIHPGARVPVAMLRWLTPAPPDPSPHCPLVSPRIRMTFAFHAANQPRQTAEILCETEGSVTGVDRWMTATASDS
jgi:hypothetical protein